jgi:hypothetical protein
MHVTVQNTSQMIIRQYSINVEASEAHSDAPGGALAYGGDRLGNATPGLTNIEPRDEVSAFFRAMVPLHGADVDGGICTLNVPPEYIVAPQY